MKQVKVEKNFIYLFNCRGVDLVNCPKGVLLVQRSWFVEG